MPSQAGGLPGPRQTKSPPPASRLDPGGSPINPPLSSATQLQSQESDWTLTLVRAAMLEVGQEPGTACAKTDYQAGGTVRTGTRMEARPGAVARGWEM